MGRSLVVPSYFLVVNRSGTQWRFQGHSEAFYNPLSTPGKPVTTPESLTVRYQLEKYQLTLWDAVVLLFRLRGGQAGYYLLDLKRRQGYYCGPEWRDITVTLYTLGIGRPDPFTESDGDRTQG